MVKGLHQVGLALVIFQCCICSPAGLCAIGNVPDSYRYFEINHLILKMGTPTITETGVPAALNTTYGTASISTSITVSGSNMVAGISVNPPTGFQVSTDNLTFNNTVNFGSAGTIPPTTIYIRLAGITAAGSYSGNITFSSPGANTVYVGQPNSIVSPASLTVTADNASKLYGATLTSGPGSTAFTSTGLKNGETIGTVSIGYGTGGQPTDAAATYNSSVAIANATGGSFSPGNYTITYEPANIIVMPVPLSIIADNVPKTYGTTLTGGAGSTAFTAIGLQNGETIGSVTIGYGTGASATDPVGTYDESVSIAAGTGGNFSGHNYIITHVPGNIIVIAAPLTITANNVIKTYGQTLTGGSGSNEFTSSGLENGETIGSVSIGYGTAGAVGATPGICDACVSVANATGGSFNPDNYTITYVPGNIEVIAAPLIITAENEVKIYGQPNPVLNLTYTGFVNGDGPDQFTSQPVATTTASSTSPPGEYPITVYGAANPNYIITYASGVLIITQSFAIPTAFTPNGDGINDTWHIQFLETIQNCTVTIINRTGQNVYNSIGYGVPWDGTYHGAALPTGVYYYIIDIKNISKVLSGYVTILR